MKTSTATPGGDIERQSAGGGFLFAIAVGVIVSAILIDVGSTVVDILLIFSISLTLAMLLIVFTAKKVKQVLGFPLLLVLATSVRLFTTLAAAGLIFSRGYAGTVLNILARPAADSQLLTAAGAGALAMVSLTVIGFTAAKIRKLTRQRIEVETPFKHISLQSEVSAGVLTFEQAGHLAEDINREGGFFKAMAGTTIFFAAEAFLSAGAISVVMLLKLTPAGPGENALGYESGQMLAALTALSMGSAVLSALACRFLLTKTAPTLIGDAQTNESYKQQYSRIQVDANQLDQAGKKQTQARSAARLWDAELLSEAESDQYEQLIQRIISNDQAGHTVLLAGLSPRELPVTAAVNLAVSLAALAGKTLLMDLDTARDPISKVFDIRPDSGKIRPIRCSVENLSIWPSTHFDGNLRFLPKILTQIRHRYQHIIIYAPAVDTSTAPNLLNGITAAMVFGRQSSDQKPYVDLEKLLRAADITLLD